MKKVLTWIVAFLFAFSSAGFAESHAPTDAMAEVEALFDHIEEELLAQSVPDESASADVSSYSGEILFRGLPWGSSIDDAVNNLRSAGIDSSRIDDSEDVHYIDFGISVENSAFSYTPSDLPDDFFVAGHLVSQVCAYAMYGIKDGKVSAETADSRLYKGTYYFEVPVDIDGLYDDLYNKLASLYGESKDNKEGYADKSEIWYGQNNTAVTLSMSSSDLVYIDYWDLGVRDMIEEMQNLRYIGDKDSLDGL